MLKIRLTIKSAIYVFSVIMVGYTVNYAAAALSTFPKTTTDLPPVSSGDTLSSSQWNEITDMVINYSESIKLQDQTVSKLE